MNIREIDAFCFDLDGTVYVGNERLAGAKQLIEWLRRNEKQVLFITNSPTQTRAECRRRLHSLGIEATMEEVLTAPFVSALFFQKRFPEACIYIVGEEAIYEEFSERSLTTTKNPLEATHVLVGLDRFFTYDKLNLAMSAVLNGAKIIVTNPDPNCPVPDGVISDTLAIARAIEVASGQSIYEVIGKPSPFYGECILETLKVDRERCLVIGDRLETDILLGKVNQFQTCLVLTGVASEADVEKQKIYPDYIFENLTALLKEMEIGCNSK